MSSVSRVCQEVSRESSVCPVRQLCVECVKRVSSVSSVDQVCPVRVECVKCVSNLSSVCQVCQLCVE